MNDQSVPALKFEDIVNLKWLGSKRCMPPRGHDKAKIMVVQSHPTKDDFLNGMTLGGASRDEVLKAYKETGIPENAVWHTSFVKYSLGSKSKPSSEQIEECRAIFEEEVRHVKPELIITLGAEAFKAVMKKNIKQSAFLGEIIDCPYNCKILPTYSPYNVFAVDPTLRSEFQEHFEYARDFILNKKKYDSFRYEVVDNVERATELFEYYLQKNEELYCGIDFEWKGQMFRDEVLYSFQICAEKDFCIILDLSKDGKTENIALLKSCEKLLTHERTRLLGWNIKEELKRLELKGIKVPDERVAFDGMMAVAFFDSRWPKGLETGIKRFTNYEPYYVEFNIEKKNKGLADDEMSDMKFVNPDVFYRYAGGDGCAHREACLNMMSKFPENQKKYYYDVYLPLTVYLKEMELVGMPIDVDLMDKLTKQYTEVHDIIQKELLAATKQYNFDTEKYEKLLAEKGEDYVKKHKINDDFNPNYFGDKRKLLFDDMKLKPVYYTYNRKVKPAAWYEKAKPNVQAQCSPSTNGKSLSTMRFQLEEALKADPDNDELKRQYHVVDCCLNLARVGVFANKFFAKKGTEFIDDVSDEDAEDDNPLKSSYWANLCPDNRIHSSFYPCLDNFRASSKPNVQNPASKVLSHIPEIFKKYGKEAPKNIRNIFYSGHPDYVFFEADIQSADVGIAAFISGDTDFIRDIRQGSFHVKKMREYFRNPNLTKEDISLYTAAKAITFNCFYISELVAAAPAIQAQLYAENGIFIELERIEYGLTTWENYKRYFAYREYCKNMAKEHGYIDNPYGMRFKFDKTDNFSVLASWQNQALAFPVASSLACFMWDASINLKKHLTNQKMWMRYAYPLCSVHDANYWLVHKALLKDNYFPEMVKYVFSKETKLPNGYNLGVDCVAASCWKGKDKVFEGETKWNFEKNEWEWKH